MRKLSDVEAGAVGAGECPGCGGDLEIRINDGMGMRLECEGCGAAFWQGKGDGDVFDCENEIGHG